MFDKNLTANLTALRRDRLDMLVVFVGTQVALWRVRRPDGVLDLVFRTTSKRVRRRLAHRVTAFALDVVDDANMGAVLAPLAESSIWAPPTTQLRSVLDIGGDSP